MLRHPKYGVWLIGLVIANLAADRAFANDWPQFLRSAARTGDGANEELELPLKLSLCVQLDDAVTTSPAVVDGKVYLSVIWHRDVPTERRELDGRVMRNIDYTHAKFAREFVDRVEAARLKLSPRLRGKALNEFTEKWMDEHLDADQKLKLGHYVKKRFTKGRAAIAIKDLDIIGEHEGKMFENHAAFEKWLTALPLSNAVKEKLRDAVPDTELQADDVVLCLDAATGKTLWKKSMPGQKSARGAACTPAISGGRLYTTGSGNLHCLDAQTGEHRWSSPIKAKSTGSSVLVAGGRVFASADTLQAFNAESGSPLWEQKEVKGKNSSPLMAGGTLIASGKKHVYGIDPETGTAKWEVIGASDASPVVSDGVLVCYAKGTKLHALRAYQIGDGEPKPLWNYIIKARRAASSPIAKDGFVYLLGGDRHLCADLKTGKIRWDEERQSSISSPAAADGKLFVLENRGGILCMLKETPEDRVELARGKVGALNTCSPAIVGTRLFVRSKNRVKCFGLGE